MADEIAQADGMLGNFERRRQIEEEAAASRPIGRDRPRLRETTPGSRLWNELHTTEKLLDEEG